MTDQETTREAALESWKEIAAYLKRDVRTAKRWEKSEGLPVRRHLHHARSSVYAYPSELDAWWATRQPALTAPSSPPAPGRNRMLHRAMFAVALLLALATSRSGPPNVVRAAAQRTGPSLTEIFSEKLALEIEAPRFSPDGKRLAAVDTGYLVVVDAATEQRTQLTKTNWDEPPYAYAGSAVWSPDGNRIAYAWFINNGYQLRVMPAQGGEPKVLFDAGSFYPYDWSPDGASILGALSRGGGVTSAAIVSVSGALAELRSLPGVTITSARYSPDGGHVAYAATLAGRSRVFVFNVATRSEIELTPGTVADRLPIWTPDGGALLFVSDRSGRSDLWSVAMRDGKPLRDPRVIYADIGDVRDVPGWNGDGRLVVTRRVSFGQLYRVSVDPRSGAMLGAPERPVPQFQGKHMQAAWSPDRGRIALLAETRERGAIYVMSPAIGDVQELNTRDLGWTRIAGWLPSNDTVFVSATPGQGPRGIYALRLTDGSRSLVHSDPDMNWASAQVSPDGSALAAAYGKTMRVVDLKRKQVIREFTWKPDEGHSGFAWAPDGRAVYAIVGQRIVRVPVGPGEPKDLLSEHSLRSIGVSPDGSTLAFSRFDPRQQNRDRYQLYVMSSGGGTPARVQLPEGHLPWRVRWAGDGQIGYISFEVKSQILRLTNFLPKD
ncbi:MAG: hypothetical protein WD690_15435 [Vicinamibacterales bacterium]